MLIPDKRPEKMKRFLDSLGFETTITDGYVDVIDKRKRRGKKCVSNINLVHLMKRK